MTPLRAAVLLALEQVCRDHVRMRGLADWQSDTHLVGSGAGATVAEISSRIIYPGLVRPSAIRKILAEERVAGHVLQNFTSIAHSWWPVGLLDKMRAEQLAAQQEWFGEVLSTAASLVTERGISADAAEIEARAIVARRRGPYPE